MPLAIVQTTDTFNNWLDATNNTTTYVQNASVLIQVAQNATPNVSTGNVAINGTVSLATLAVNASSNLAGTNANVSANLNVTGLSIFASNVTVDGMLTVANTATFTNFINAAGAYVNVAGTFRVAGATALIGATALSNTIAVTGNATLSNTLAVTGAVTLSNTIAITGASVFSNTVNTAGLLTALAGFTSNATTTIAGPFLKGATFVTTLSQSGAGVFNNANPGANAVMCIITGDTNNTNTTGIVAADPTVWRELILVNAGNYDITLTHEDTGSTANNRLWCPSNTAFAFQKQTAVMLIYDANTSVRRWRVLAGAKESGNASALITGTVPYSVLPSTLINTTSTTGINASGLSFGTVPNARLDANIIFTTSTTGMNASALSIGTVPNARLDPNWFNNLILTTSTTGINASALSVGTVPIARLDSSVILTTSTTGINASALSVGTVPDARLASASAVARGVVDTSAQSFAGLKTFTGSLQVSGGQLVVDSGGQINGANQTLTGFLYMGGKLYFDTTGRIVLPVGTDKWAV